jgi:hypothetical protein
VICGLSCGLHLAQLWHEPQPTTVSHDGGCAGRPRTRMPRRTHTGLSHATGLCRRPEQAATAGPVLTARETSVWQPDHTTF